MDNLGKNIVSSQVVVVQLPSRVRLFATPWTAACQASLSLTNSWSLPKFTSIASVMPSSHLILCRSLLSSIFPSVRDFPNEWVIWSDDQNTGASASASVLPMSIQGWFLSRLTGLISLVSKGLLGVFCSTTVWRDQFFGALPSFSTALTTVHDYWENNSADYACICWQSVIFAF